MFIKEVQNRLDTIRAAKTEADMQKLCNDLWTDVLQGIAEGTNEDDAKPLAAAAMEACSIDFPSEPSDSRRLYIVETGDEEGHSEVILRSANRGKSEDKLHSYDLPSYAWITLSTFKLQGDGEWIKADPEDKGYVYITRSPDLGGDVVTEYEPMDSMDGDAESALASAGMGTDEDYGSF